MLKNLKGTLLHKNTTLIPVVCAVSASPPRQEKNKRRIPGKPAFFGGRLSSQDFFAWFGHGYKTFLEDNVVILSGAGWMVAFRECRSFLDV